MDKGVTYSLRNIDPMFWRSVKVAAAQNNLSIKDLIQRALSDYITRGRPAA